MYTKKEVAEILKVSIHTVTKHIAEKKIAIIKLGGAVRITEEELSRIKKEGF